MSLEQKKDYITVTELTQTIKQTLEQKFPKVVVQGEISNFKVQASGHMYFTLKDANAQILCVMFRGHASGLNRMPKEGDQVQILGEIGVYPPRGYYQLIVRGLKYVGVGELLLKFQQLKEQLLKQGWFNKKQSLPKLPKRIGVITSPTGAVIRDIIHVLDRRFGTYHLILNPVKVQGEGAKEEIALAIEEMNRYQLCDVLIVGRGGGSFEDLFPFSEYIVAKAIFESTIPIISAVGHETDVSIADFVADVRAPTPSAAAEIVLGEKKQLLNQLEKGQQALKRSLQFKLTHYQEALKRIVNHPFMKDPYTLLGNSSQKLDEMKSLLDRILLFKLEQQKNQLETVKRLILGKNPQQNVKLYRQQLAQSSRQLTQLLAKVYEQKEAKFRGVQQTLQAINPKNLLNKGYSILFSEKEGSVINKTIDLQRSRRVIACLSDGEGVLDVIETNCQG